MYRLIQILEICFNNFHKTSVVIELAFFCLALPISIYAVIKVNLNGMEALFFAMAMIDSPIDIIGNFGIHAEIFKSSRNLLIATKACYKVQCNRHAKRICRSWPVLSSRFGYVNYIDPFLPLNTLDMCLNNTVSLLLM